MALEDLMRYESAAVAAANIKKDSGLAVTAMADFYKKALGEEDPIIMGNLEEAVEGAEEGQISNRYVLRAMHVYGGKYERAFATTKFSDLIKYLTDGYKVSDEAMDVFNKYNENTIEQLAKKMKEDKEMSENDKKEIGKMVQALSLLKSRRLKVLEVGIYDRQVTGALSQMYPKKEEKEEE